MMSVVEAAADVTPSYSRDTAESGGEMTRAKLEDLISEEEEEEEEEEDDPKSVAASTESSSIGQPDDDDDDDDDDEVQSSLSSLASLDDSLPIKKNGCRRRGLSKFYGGKSKSFGNIGEVRNVKELGKAENPFNKRRRTLMAYNLMFQTKEDNIYNKNKSAPAAGGNGKGNGKSKGKGGSFYSHSNHISMPLLPLAEDEDEDDVKDDSSDADDYRAISRLQQIKEQPYPSLYKPTPTSTSPVNNNSNNNCILHVSDHSHSHSHSQLVSHT